MEASRGELPTVSPVCSSGPQPDQSRLVVLLLGEKRSGKSLVGNSILGKLAFHEETTRSSREDGAAFGTQVTVVDTPGWMSHSLPPDRVSEELRRGLTLCRQDPHVILLALPCTSTFGQPEWRAMEAQLRLLQTPIWQKAMVLFTRADKLGGLPIQEHIRRQGRTLQWLLERCGNRYQVLSAWSESQHSELFEKIRKVVEVNQRPKEMRDRMYTQLRQELAARGARKSWGGRVEIDDWKPGHMERTASRQTFVPRGFLVEPARCEPVLSLVLLGRRRSGKSSAGNTILDREEFRPDTKTTRCTAGHGRASGRAVTVVDTPGWSLFGLANSKEVRAEVRRSPSLCPQRSRVSFLLAVPVGPFGEKDRRAVEKNLGVLGSQVWGSTAVLFTFGEELRGRKVEEHVEESGRPLQWLLDRCGRRYRVLDTRTGDGGVDQLLEMVEQLWARYV
ncbi:GTPase IMAP family member 8 [Gasterosteus aculeatus]